MGDTTTVETRIVDMLPDYPQIERGDGLLIHTRKQAEAGKIKAQGTRIPHEGTVK